MPSYLDNAAAKVASAAGWREPKPDGEGRYRFALQGGLALDMFSPDGNAIILRAAVQPLPDEEAPRENLLRAKAKLAVAASRERKTVLALEDDNLILHRVLPSKETPLENMPGIVKAFLNDLDWWKAQAARLAS